MPPAVKKISATIRHRPRNYLDMSTARCGVKRDLKNQIVLSNRGINCVKCNAIQAQYAARAKKDLEAIESKTRAGPLRVSIQRTSQTGTQKKK